MKKLIDLSHPIQDKSPCSFRVDNIIPEFIFSQDDLSGCFYVNSQIDNLNMNYGTRVILPGAVPGKKNSHSISDYPIDSFSGDVIIIDISEKFQNIKNFFDKNGRYKMKLDDEEASFEFLLSLEKITVTLTDINAFLKKENINPDNVDGILFYTGLSKYWINEKFESWEYIYFCGTTIDKECLDYIVENNFKFIGIDSFRLGNSVIHFNAQEKPFVLSKKCKDYICHNNKYSEEREVLLENNVFIYENLNIHEELINKKVEFFGLPMNIGIKGFDCCSVVRPFVKIDVST